MLHVLSLQGAEELCCALDTEMLTEPATSITDLMLAAESFLFAAFCISRRGEEISILLWGLAFVAVGLSAMSGAVYHGLAQSLTITARTHFAAVTADTMLLGFALFLSAGAYSAAAGFPRSALLGLILCGLVIGLILLRRNPGEGVQMRHSVLIIGILMLVLAVVLVRQVLAHGAQSGNLILTASLVILAGTAVQQMKIGLHRHFNHNDLCHIFFMVGLFFLYRGGLLLKDR